MCSAQSGFTPLHIASHYGSLDVAKLLLDNGADIDFAARVCSDYSNTDDDEAFDIVHFAPFDGSYLLACVCGLTEHCSNSRQSFIVLGEINPV